MTGGHIPRDSTYVTEKEMIIPMKVYITMSTLAGLGVVGAIMFFLFNVIHRQHRYGVTL